MRNNNCDVFLYYLYNAVILGRHCILLYDCIPHTLATLLSYGRYILQLTFSKWPKAKVVHSSQSYFLTVKTMHVYLQLGPTHQTIQGVYTFPLASYFVVVVTE